MKWHQWFVGTVAFMMAVNAEAAPRTCADRFAAAGIKDTSDLHAGRLIRLDGEPVVVQIGDVADSVCHRVDAVISERKKVATEVANAKHAETIAEQQLATEIAKHEGNDPIVYLYNHVIHLVVLASVLAGMLIGMILNAFWLTFKKFYL